MSKITKEDIAAGVAIGGIGIFGFGCCLGLIAIVFVSRLSLLYGLFFSNWYNAFDSTIIAILGWIIAPWTSLAWMYIYFNNGGEINGIYLICLIIGILMDFGSWTSSQIKRNK